MAFYLDFYYTAFVTQKDTLKYVSDTNVCSSIPDTFKAFSFFFLLKSLADSLPGTVLSCDGQLICIFSLALIRNIGNSRLSSEIYNHVSICVAIRQPLTPIIL